MSNELAFLESIQHKIHTIRCKQVMLDSDLAKLYGVSTKRLNEQVKRNSERFPKDFCFQLNIVEKTELVAKCDHLSKLKFSHVFPHVFTEQGVAMLSSVLKSKKAAEVNISIMRAFVTMREFLIENKDFISDLHFIKSKVFDHDKNFEKVFRALERTNLPQKGIFFDGQVFDAYKFIVNLITSAKKRIILIDNYVDVQTLELLSNKKRDVNIKIYTKNINHLKQAFFTFNKQYPKLELIHFEKSHDRFLIVDEEIYHIGASLKDLGKKWFAFSKLNIDNNLILSKLK